MAAVNDLLFGRRPLVPGGRELRPDRFVVRLVGNFLIDDTFLAGEGVTDFDQYRIDPSQRLSPDFFVPDDSQPPASVSLAAKVPPAEPAPTMM